METLTFILLLFVAGLIIGALARLVVPGTGGMGLLATSLAGIGGSLLAGLLSREVIQPRNDLISFLLAVACAALLVWLFAGGRRSRF